MTSETYDMPLAAAEAIKVDTGMTRHGHPLASILGPDARPRRFPGVLGGGGPDGGWCRLHHEEFEVRQ